uniref:Arachidonate epidermal lipoxygenase 3 n=1 Tax=Takifugu rubripes TaxID=31033 RepID=A0A674P1B9_TAKRU
MLSYDVTVSTADIVAATTFNNVFIKLVGEDGESERKWLINFKGAAVSKFTVHCSESIGKLVLIELDKQGLLIFPEDSWFPSKVEVKSPEGDVYVFPIYRWIDDNQVHRFREGTALRVFEDTHLLGRHSRERELKEREEDYRLTELQLKGLDDCEENWPDIDSIDRVFCCKKTDISEYVQDHWKEDSFFGYQFLNAVNPTMIRRCSALPGNLPVTDEMVFSGGQFRLEEEMQKGNIFLCDYKSLDGIKANTINGKQQYLMAPLVLLHKTPDDKLMPIAIQLKQIPAGDNPIFFPSDSEYDWLTAKIFVRSAEFSEHQLNAHLLRTHLLAEVFAVSLLRNVPMVHPLYKLLIPHTRYTLQINYLARRRLIAETGVFTEFSATGGEGMITFLKKSLSSVTYSSLCLPDNISERGLESVPNFYYRDDGLRLWSIINRFVQGVLSFYYKNDLEVKQDSELQKWIQDIYEHGFLSQKDTGELKAAVVRFVTMVVFTCSAQHSAVNGGQYDYGGWMPNNPITLQLPPPTTKGTTSEATMLKTLPDVNATVQGMATMWLLSKRSTDFVSLGQYPEEHFSEEIPFTFIKDFQAELRQLSAEIEARNVDLEIPYTYMDPGDIENSVAI